MMMKSNLWQICADIRGKGLLLTAPSTFIPTHLPRAYALCTSILNRLVKSEQRRLIGLWHADIGSSRSKSGRPKLSVVARNAGSETGAIARRQQQPIISRESH
mmetsp:Transcript_22365/g.52644  ORF Transcript_22365/g.52644 Transcript_22365/m.52644 type:complete len:103 (+) Transcript_22365:1136-1444(+)